ncbi:hypothetical protein [Paeniglutamicibacter psychrophenolicus]|uniref:hypothetical protein n=1 Tax=Paeniglutamicibacter psychrophenolicus TaxID=257454 RepID=UPI00278053D4|nr:hypothetical protein [Paeniglutamicibacter psychrophenolicus]MDQ0096293.1 hypothetical protein [Paeniglutamicibacter psychrophenolicus]
MRTTTRNITAIVLMVLAVLLGSAAMLGSAAARLADTPGPLQGILGPLASDPELRRVLPATLGTELAARITAQTAVPQILAGPLDNAIATAGGALFEDPSFRPAWEATIEATRVDFTARLQAAKDPGPGSPAEAEQVTLHLDLAPLLGSGYRTLHGSLQGSALGAVLPEAIPAAPVLLDTGWPRADQLPTETLDNWLSLARGWVWMLGGAVLAAAAGMLLATRTGRPWALLAGGAAALLLGTATRLWAGSLGSAGTGGGTADLEALVTNRLAAGVAGEFGAATTILVTGGIIVLLAGAGWAWLASRTQDPGPRG